MTADNGAFTPVMDKPEQALDLVRDAISGAGYSYEDDVAVALNFATKDIYDKVRRRLTYVELNVNCILVVYYWFICKYPGSINSRGNMRRYEWEWDCEFIHLFF